MSRLTKNRKEVESVAEMVAIALGRKQPKHVIKGMIRRKLAELSGVQPEDVSARTCESYLARGRELILKLSDKPKAEHLLEAACFYRSVIMDPRSSAYVKLRCRERLDELFGLNPPLRREVIGKTQTSPRVTIDDLVTAYKKARQTLGTGEAEDLASPACLGPSEAS